MFGQMFLSLQLEGSVFQRTESVVHVFWLLWTWCHTFLDSFWCNGCNKAEPWTCFSLVKIYHEYKVNKYQMNIKRPLQQLSGKTVLPKSPSRKWTCAISGYLFFIFFLWLRRLFRPRVISFFIVVEIEWFLLTPYTIFFVFCNFLLLCITFG